MLIHCSTFLNAIKQNLNVACTVFWGQTTTNRYKWNKQSRNPLCPPCPGSSSAFVLYTNLTVVSDHVDTSDPAFKPRWPQLSKHTTHNQTAGAGVCVCVCVCSEISPNKSRTQRMNESFIMSWHWNSPSYVEVLHTVNSPIWKQTSGRGQEDK